jgi:hypothetical protein
VTSFFFNRAASFAADKRCDHTYVPNRCLSATRHQVGQLNFGEQSW